MKPIVWREGERWVIACECGHVDSWPAWRFAIKWAVRHAREHH